MPYGKKELPTQQCIYTFFHQQTTMQISADTRNSIINPALKVGAATGPSLHSPVSSIAHGLTFSMRRNRSGRRVGQRRGCHLARIPQRGIILGDHGD